MGGDAETVTTYLEEHYVEGAALDAALQVAVAALGHSESEDRVIPTSDLEVAVLDRTRAQPRKFARILPVRLDTLLGERGPAIAGPPEDHRARTPAARPRTLSRTTRRIRPTRRAETWIPLEDPVSGEPPIAPPSDPSTTSSESQGHRSVPKQAATIQPEPPSGTVRFTRGPADLRHRERVRRDVHVQGSAPPEPGRGRPLPVPQGGELGAQQQRLPAQRRPALPRRRQPPRVRHAGVRRHRRAGHPRQGGGAGARGAAPRRRAAPARRGHLRRDLPVQEQHRLRRQLLRLPRELPRRPRRGVQPARRRADPVPGDPADHGRRREGDPEPPRAPATASASAPSTSGRASAARPPGAGRSSTPATSRTPTPRSTGVST